MGIELAAHHGHILIAVGAQLHIGSNLGPAHHVLLLGSIDVQLAVVAAHHIDFAAHSQGAHAGEQPHVGAAGSYLPFEYVGFLLVYVHLDGVVAAGASRHAHHAQGAGLREVHRVDALKGLQRVAVYVLHQRHRRALRCHAAYYLLAVYAHGQRVGVVYLALGLVYVEYIFAAVQRSLIRTVCAALRHCVADNLLGAE